MPLGNSMRELVDRDGSVVATAAARPKRQSGGGGDSSSSSSDDDDGDEMADDDVTPMATPLPSARPKPHVDEDGFQTVVRGRR